MREPVYEKGYPSYEAVNRTEPQERYHDYIGRMYKETEMTIENRLIALKNKHHLLDKKIEALISEKAPDQYVTPLKKEKLLLKEEIVKIEKKLL